MKRLLIMLVFISIACNSKVDYSPRKINFDRDVCAVCKMGLTDQRYSAQAINKFGEVYWFDDIGCLVELMQTDKWKTWGGDSAKIYIGNGKTGEWLNARKAYYYYGKEETPMGYGYVAVPENKGDSLYTFTEVVKRISQGKTSREKYLEEYNLLKEKKDSLKEKE